MTYTILVIVFTTHQVTSCKKDILSENKIMTLNLVTFVRGTKNVNMAIPLNSYVQQNWRLNAPISHVRVLLLRLMITKTKHTKKLFQAIFSQNQIHFCCCCCCR